MSARDELARLMYVADNHNQPEAESLKDWDIWLAGSKRDTYVHRMADAALAAGYTKPRTITEVFVLNALQYESVIRTPQGYTLEKLSDGWYRAGVDSAYTPNPKWLPATVLYEPEPTV